MTLKYSRKLDLLWRIVGINILIILIGVLQVSKNPEMAIYVIFSNIYLVCYLGFQVVKRNLSMTSKMKEIITIYSICKLVINFVLIQNEYQCMISILCSILEGMWIVRFYMLEKIKK